MSLSANERLAVLSVWQGRKCVICKRSTRQAILNIEATIHHNRPLICVDRKSCERLCKKQAK